MKNFMIVFGLRAFARDRGGKILQLTGKNITSADY
jgi:hypothetical protein